MADPDDRREHLRRRYRELVDVELLGAAARHGRPIRRNHCFGRVLLDDAVGASWYDVLGRGHPMTAGPAADGGPR